jgi:hypothetical protein
MRSRSAADRALARGVRDVGALDAPAHESRSAGRWMRVSMGRLELVLLRAVGVLGPGGPRDGNDSWSLWGPGGPHPLRILELVYVMPTRDPVVVRVAALGRSRPR